MNFYRKLLLKIGDNVLNIKNVSDEEYKRRLNICQTSDCLNADGTCSICGCLMESKAKGKIHRNIEKLRNEITHCPKAKWGESKEEYEAELEIVNYYRIRDKKELLKSKYI